MSVSVQGSDAKLLPKSPGIVGDKPTHGYATVSELGPAPGVMGTPASIEHGAVGSGYGVTGTAARPIVDLGLDPGSPILGPRPRE